MDVGIAVGGGIPDSALADDEIDTLLRSVKGCPDKRAFTSSIQDAFDKTLYWKFFDDGGATWAEVRPALENVISVLKAFCHGMKDYQSPLAPAPEAAVQYVIGQEDWPGQLAELASLPELYESAATHLELAEQALRHNKQRAVEAGRPRKENFRRLVASVHTVLRDLKLDAPIDTDRTTSVRTSIFWETVVNAYSRLTRSQYAECASMNAALGNVKRWRQEFSKENKTKAF